MGTDMGRRGTIDSLTGFRFAAAMLVFFSHYPVPGSSGAALRTMLSGYAGVTLFFVLSGFVIGYTYLERFEESLTGRNVGEYFVARLARFYPLYVFFIVFGWFAQGLDFPWLHILGLQAWDGDIRVAFGVNAVAWSVCVEIFLYLAFPLLVPILARAGVLGSFSRLRIATVLVAVAMIVLAAYFAADGRDGLPLHDPAAAHRWLYRTPVTRLGDFLLGIFGAVYFMRFAKSDPGSVRRWGWLTSAAAVLVLLLLLSKKNYHSAYSWDVAYALPAIVMIVGLAINRETFISRLLASAPLVLLGEASYAFYLAHVPSAPLQHGSPRHPYELGLYVIFIVMLVAMSIGLHIGVERPARRWIRSLLSRGPKPAPAPPQAPAQAPEGVAAKSLSS